MLHTSVKGHITAGCSRVVRNYPISYALTTHFCTPVLRPRIIQAGGNAIPFRIVKLTSDLFRWEKSMKNTFEQTRSERK